MSDDRSLESRVKELEGRVEELEVTVSDMVPSVDASASANEKKVAAAELVRQGDFDTYKEKALALGYHEEFVEGSEGFTGGGIDRKFRSAKLDPPGNPHQVIARLASDGLIMEAGKDGGSTQWELTQSGIEEVKEGFGHE